MGIIHNDLKILNDLFKGHTSPPLSTSEILVFIALALIMLAAIFYMEILNDKEKN
jgi:hypothetical protein